MDAKLLNRLKNCNSLPTLPAVAARLIELGRDPDASMEDMGRAVKLDPALSAKILRMANSPVYARRRRCDNFQQALVLLGLNATMTVALTFTLASSLREETQTGLDLARFWRRSILSAHSCRVLGLHLGHKAPEDLFFAALFQDLGELALDRAVSDLYSALAHDAQNHAELVALERNRLDADHAEVGSWLLEQWRLPELQQRAVRLSHTHFNGPAANQDDMLIRAVAVSGAIADVWFSDSYAQACQSLQDNLRDALGLEPQDTLDVLEGVTATLPEVEKLFDVELSQGTDAEWLLAEARDALVLRNLMMVQESAKLRETAELLHAQAKALEERSRIDMLTKVYNRGHLDAVLPEHFKAAERSNVPISLIFIDIDDFKLVNDRHGHHCGDKVLIEIAALLRGQARDADIVSRFGGEEFVVVLPATGSKGAWALGERIMSEMRQLQLADEGSTASELRVTASLGIATHGEGERFEDALALCKAGDKALYQAKRSGKNRAVLYRSNMGADEAA